MHHTEEEEGESSIVVDDEEEAHPKQQPALSFASSVAVPELLLLVDLQPNKLACQASHMKEQQQQQQHFSTLP